MVNQNGRRFIILEHEYGKLSRSFFHICLSSWGERSPHEPRSHDQGPLVPGLSENTNSVRGENDLHGTRYTQSSMIFKSFFIFFSVGV